MSSSRMVSSAREILLVGADGAYKTVKSVSLSQQQVIFLSIRFGRVVLTDIIYIHADVL